MPLKLADLAREAGVHASTVSRVLSGDPKARLSEETRQRIMELAAITGFGPNRLAQALKRRRTNMLSVLVPDVTNPMFAALFRAVEEAANAAGCCLVLCDTDENAERTDQQLNVLGDGQVDGFL